MDKFNLTYDGKILPGLELAEVKQRFAKAMLIDDAERIERIFSGEVITLRKNLDKDAAEAFYTKMHRLGAIIKLEPIAKPVTKSKSGLGKEFRHETPDSIEQSWPVSRTPGKVKKPAVASKPKPGNAVVHAEELARKQAAEEAARKKAAQRAAKKKEKEIAAKIKAKELAARKKAAEEAAKKKAAEMAARKREKEEAAKKKAEEIAARKKIAAEAARKKAAEVAARKKAREEAAKKKAEEMAARKKAREEAARIKAEKLAARKKAAEEAARKKMEEVAARKIAAEEAAALKAAERAAREKSKEEATRRKELAAREKAEKLAAKLKAEEEQKIAAQQEAARVRAEIERQQEQEMARAKAEDIRIRAERLAREHAAEQARKNEELEREARERAKKKAQDEAAIQAALDDIAQKKLDEEKAAQRALELAVNSRRDDEEANLRSKLAEQKRKHAEQAARAAAEEEQIEQALRELVANRKVEVVERKKRAVEEGAHKDQLRKSIAAKRREEKRLEEEALQRAAEGSARLEQLKQHSPPPETSPPPTPKTRAQQVPKPGVKSSAPKTSPKPNNTHAKPQAEPHRPAKKLRSGAPNLFQLEAFRDTPDIHTRAAQSSKLMKAMFLTAIASLLVLILLGLRYEMLTPPSPPPGGVRAILVDPHSGLILTAGSRLYFLDRSGTDTHNISLLKMGLSASAQLLAFDSQGQLIVQDKRTDAIGAWETVRCELEQKSCQKIGKDFPNGYITSLVVDKRTGNMFFANPKQKLLSKLASSGTLLAQTTIEMPERPKLILNEGLLYMNSPSGAAIRVLRQDNTDFAQQLDEVLMPPSLLQGIKNARVEKFLRQGDTWWVVVGSPESSEAGLYRFDTHWKLLSEVTLEAGSYPEQLLSWADKILVADSHSTKVQRFNTNGQAEIPLTAKQLQRDINHAQQRIERSQRLWQLCFVLLAILGVGSYLLGRLQQVRALVYKCDKVRGAEPIDDKAKQISWVDFNAARQTSVIKLAGIYALLSLGIVIGLGFVLVPLKVILAVIFVLAGPAVALALLYFSQTGHIGVYHRQLILVDHSNKYHIGSGAQIQHWGNFLLMDDVVVFTGSRYIRIFSDAALAKQVAPLASAGVKVDARTVGIKLLQGSHPIAKGIIACLSCIGAAIFCILLL